MTIFILFFTNNVLSSYSSVFIPDFLKNQIAVQN